MNNKRIAALLRDIAAELDELDTPPAPEPDPASLAAPDDNKNDDYTQRLEMALKILKGDN